MFVYVLPVVVSKRHAHPKQAKTAVDCHPQSCGTLAHFVVTVAGCWATPVKTGVDSHLPIPHSASALYRGLLGFLSVRCFCCGCCCHRCCP